MVYPFYVNYDLPSCCVLLLSWFGNKLSIQYIMNLSSANYPYFWNLFFVYLCQIILMHAPYYSTHELCHLNPLIAHKCLEGSPILEYHLHYKENLTTIYVFMLLRYYTYS